MLDRREFLKSTAALLAATAIPVTAFAKPAKYTLWGDGIHDDTAALNAIFRGEDDQVVVAGAGFERKGDMIHLRHNSIDGGYYRISEPIRMNQDCKFSNATIRPMPGYKPECAILMI